MAISRRTPSNQLSLLDPQTLSKESEVLFQANALTSAYYDMTPLQKNIMYMVQSMLGPDDTPDKEYILRIRDIMSVTESENQYKNLQMATESMMQKIMSIPVNGNLLQVAPFSSVFYNYGQGTITISIDNKLRPFLFNLDTKFTTFGREDAMNLSSRYAKRLYEMLSQWKSMGIMKITVQELKQRLKLHNPDTKEEHYPAWQEFRRRVLEPAIDEINTNTDLNVKYYPEREHRKVHLLKWTIKVLKTHTLAPTPSDMHEKLIAKFNLRPDQAQYVISHFDTVFIYKKCYEIEVKNASKAILNIGAYTAKVFGVQ